MLAIQHDDGESGGGVVEADLKSDGVVTVRQDVGDAADVLASDEQSEHDDGDKDDGGHGGLAVGVHGAENLRHGVVSPHDKEGAGQLDELSLEGGNGGEHHRDHDQLAARAAPHFLAEHRQDVRRVVGVGELCGRQDQVRRDGKEFVEEEHDDGADHSAETRGGLGRLGFFVQVRGDVPAPEVESGEEGTGHEAVKSTGSLEDGGREPVPREGGVVRRLEDGEEGKEDKEGHLGAGHDDLHAHRHGNAGGDGGHHGEEEEGAEEGHQSLVIGPGVREQAEDVGTRGQGGDHREDEGGHHE